MSSSRSASVIGSSRESILRARALPNRTRASRSSSFRSEHPRRESCPPMCGARSPTSPAPAPPPATSASGRCTPSRSGPAELVPPRSPGGGSRLSARASVETACSMRYGIEGSGRDWHSTNRYTVWPSRSRRRHTASARCWDRSGPTRLAAASSTCSTRAGSRPGRGKAPSRCQMNVGCSTKRLKAGSCGRRISMTAMAVAGAPKAREATQRKLSNPPGNVPVQSALPPYRFLTW